MDTEIETTTLYALVAEFDDPEKLLHAAERTREAGYKNVDAYTPFPVHGLADVLKFHDWRIPWLIFLGGLGGCAGGYALCYYVNVMDYPLNVGGRPLNSWPAFIPITFECTILLAALTAVFGMLALNGFPQPYRSIFNTPHFDRASQDRFFLAIEARDPRFDAADTFDFLRSLGADAVSEVER